ncbi:core protein VP6 [Striped bass reovirus]|uniref:Core protein VP6 n=1 Tax=Striped bass reovirus TaxID=56095 RepID=Q8JTB3_9REOV|nr:core protein VP6 [Striped bass reovirus]
MARRTFVGFTPSFYGQPGPLFTNDDYLDLAGTTVRPWQNRITNIAINSGGYPVWGGKYPTVASRQLILNALLGAHVAPYSAGAINQFNGIAWRDALLSSFVTVPPAVAPAPPDPPIWVPAGDVRIDSNQYPTYGLKFDAMWPQNQDLHMMTMWSLTDRGPISLLTFPRQNIPAMVSTAMKPLVGASVTQIAIRAYRYSGQLPQEGASIQALVHQWLACILFGSLTGRLHRGRTCEGFFFAYSKPAASQDDMILRWSDGPRAGKPVNDVTVYIAAGSPHWQQSMLHISFAMLSQSSSCLRALPTRIRNNNLPARAHNIAGLTGGGGGLRDIERYNVPDLAVRCHAAWFADGIIDAPTQAVYDAATNARFATFMAHITAMEIANPIANGRIVVQPFANGDDVAIFETAQVVAAALRMFL